MKIAVNPWQRWLAVDQDTDQDLRGGAGLSWRPPRRCGARVPCLRSSAASEFWLSRARSRARRVRIAGVASTRLVLDLYMYA